MQNSQKSGSKPASQKKAKTVVGNGSKAPSQHPSQTQKHELSPSHVSGSRQSRASLALRAKKAALLAEAAGASEKDELEIQIVKLQQEVKRVELQTEIQKLEAEAVVLDEDSQQASDDDDGASAPLSSESEHARRNRVDAWVQGTCMQQHHQELNPLAPEFKKKPTQDMPAPVAIEEMMQVLQMPKTEMVTFDGDPVKYWTFIKSFENAVGRYRQIDDQAKLARLLQYCTGRAYKVIESCAAMTTGGYTRALQLLHERFGDKYAISAAWVERVTSGQRVTNDSLQEYADQLLNLLETLRALDCMQEMSQGVLVQLVMKLPTYLQHRWKRRVVVLREQSGQPVLQDLVNFAQSAAREISDPVYGSIGVSKPAKKGFHGTTTLQTQAGFTSAPRQCPACQTKECSSLFRCDAFKALTPEKRLDLAKRNRLCFNCLRRAHTSAECRSESTCEAPGCRMKHTKFLHTSRPRADTQRGEQSKESAENKTDATVAACVGTPRVVLPVVKVKITALSGRSRETFALLDSGSTNTFCQDSLLRDLQSKGEHTNLHLTTLNSKGNKVSTSVHTLQLSDPQGRSKVTVDRVYSRPAIPISTECMVKYEDLEKWEHLKGISVPNQTEGAQVELLIGQDCPHILMPLEVRASEQGGPFATRTLFGWSINGPLAETTGRSTASVNFVSSKLERQVEEFWKIEGAQLSDNSKGMSVEDHSALNIMEESAQLENGHYSIAIPFRERPPSLPNNRAQAEARLAGLGRKLEKNPTLKDAYSENMEALLQNGHAEKVVPRDDAPKTEWYLPHHAVVNPRKKKVRVVFDCAARYADTSLNDQVLQGPDMTNSLLGVLLRFREHPVAISADVEGMFLQVKVPEDDRDSLRFLWWPDRDTKGEPETYRMTSHLFGGTWSPSVCTYALQKTAKDNASDFEPHLVDTVLRDFYVDDCLKSVPADREAITIATELPRLLQRGGFRLHKWLSNSTEVLKAIPETERAAGVQQLNFQALPVERALGVLWDVNRDTFTYDKKISDRPCNRRGLLSVVSSIYDPMGFLTPFTIRGKKLVQDLARDQVDWDQPLSENHLTSWQEWLKEIDDISLVQIPRCIQPADFGEVCRAELHHFSDASTAAYGSASYIRLINSEGEVQCNLLFSRSRVAPLKQLTIPRLELAAAALSVQQDKMLRKELSIPIQDSIFWTDSTIVLAYIQNTTKRFHTYVANRLSLIHSGSCVRQWRHVASADNPADDLSRGLHVQEMVRSRWFQGPPCLSQLTVEEGKSPEIDLEGDPEVKRSATAHATMTTENVLSSLIERFSSWTKLKRTTAWLLRYRANLLSKVRGQQLVKGQLSVEELEAAEEATVRHVQEQAYRDELRSLRAAIHVKENSQIANLDPALTSKGILVCRTRAQSTECPSQPVIMPKNHTASRLIATHYHEASGHTGREATVCQILRKYWIVGARRLVRQIISECRKCRRLYSKPMEQRMADLPKERVDAKEPPFTNVGVDCFGPFLTKSGRKQHKRYGCIFTCLTTRAIHLEVLDTMDTSSFINALQRFISRRGYPKTICSDQGTNFVGAERELRESLQQLNFDSVDAFLSQRSVQWKFNPAGASHMGGAWERLIRSVRRTLQSVMTEQVTSDDALTTLFCLTENIINSRPLTTVSDDPNDFEALTPNHLLLLRPMPQLPPGVFEPKDCYVRKRWRQVQYLVDVFWRRWLHEYMPLIQLRSKWTAKRENLSVGDVVLIVDYAVPRNQWRLGRVSTVRVGTDGLVRSAEVRTNTATITRPIHKLCYLEGRSSQDKSQPD